MKEACFYRALPIRTLPSSKQTTLLMLIWLLSNILSVGVGLLSVFNAWTLLPLQIGSWQVSWLFYPPMTLCALWMMWFGFWWGAIPAYLATLTFAFYSHIPFDLAWGYALAEPLSLGVLTIAYRTLPISLSLRNWDSFILFVVLNFISHAFGSVGALIWSYGQGDLANAFTTWQSWWQGGFIQSLVTLPPLLWLFTPMVTRWRDTYFDTRRPELGKRHVFVAVATLVLGILLFLLLSYSLSQLSLTTELRSGHQLMPLPEALQTLKRAAMSVYGVIACLVVMLTFVGYRFFKQWAVALEAAVDSTRQANAAKSDFLARMSHEIRTPLNAILGLGQLLQKTTLNRNQKDYLQKIFYSAELLLAVVNDLLDFSRIESGKLVLEKTDFKLDDVLEKVASIVVGRAEEKHLELLLEVEPDLPTLIVGDPLRLEQVLINLVNNAVKFTEKGYVLVRVKRVRQEGAEVELQFEVQDSGIGISAEQQGKLFQAFSQADESMARRYGGSGLGLAISQHLVNQMGGNIQVNSVQGQGSLFFFQLTFPMRFSMPTRRSFQSSAVAMRGKRVLVMYDSPLACRLISEMLQNLGVTTAARDTNQPLTNWLIKQQSSYQPIDLVLMDCQVAGRDGVEWLRELRLTVECSNLPVVMLTTVSLRESLQQEAVRLGLNGLLVKPVSYPSLLTTLQSVFSGQMLRLEREGDTAEESVSDLKAAFAQHRVLLVEDNPINRQIALDSLESAGVRVEVAENGLQAVEMAGKQSYGLIMMDIQMPEMDGVAATRLLRQQGMTMPIIAMTAHALSEDRERCLQAGMNDHLCKPFTPDEMQAMLRRWLPASVGSAVAPAQELMPNIQPSEILDPWAGLRRVGNRHQLYRSILQRFYHEYSDGAARLVKLLTSGEVEELERVAHSLKSVAGYIGADILSAQAEQLEKLLKGKQGSPEELLSAQRRVSEALGQVLSRLKDMPMTSESKELVRERREQQAKPCVMIVDDGAIHRQVLSALLSDEFDVVEVDDGNRALVMAVNRQPDLILLDMVLKGTSGEAVLRSIKEHGLTRNIAVMIISSKDALQDEEQGLAWGACDYIIKPFHPGIVRARVRNALKMVQQRKLLEQLAHLDGLTSLPNRRKLEMTMQDEWERALRLKQPLSMLILDVDHFKRFNDTYGHASGDEVLRAVGRTMQTLLRPSDLAARLGGEEFVLLLPETDMEGAKGVAERLRHSIEMISLPQLGRVTASMGGVTVVPEADTDMNAALEEADRMLYQAKEGGRNQVRWQEVQLQLLNLKAGEEPNQ